MSFSSKVKEELLRIRLKDSRVRLSQLSGLVLSCGSLRLGGGAAIVCQTESLAVARHILSLASGLFKLDSALEMKEREHRRTPLMVLTLDGEDIKKLLLLSGAISEDGEGLHFRSGVPTKLISTDECRRAFLRGCFLGSGSCTNPKRSYHLEMVCKNEAFAEELCALINEFTLNAKSAQRKNRAIVYLKDGDDVMGFLACVGANVGAMELESVRVEKEVRNYLNRTSNCENANMDKAAAASARQMQAIRKIMDRADISKLPRSLIQAAQLRLNHPEATIGDLATMAGIQKSGMNHRLDRLMKIARELD
ncbi:MAG: DNA-binding protein WhiA [Clostridia bacterium]|nr:DNA-binding protein WhiA [Clostridia bacterium]